MPLSPPRLAHDEAWPETDIRNERCVYHAVRVHPHEARSWLQEAPVVPSLVEWKILHAGIGEFPQPFEHVRTALAGAFFIACTHGEGEVFLDGKWTLCRPGHAVLLLPGVLNALRTRGDEPWGFCWVRFQRGVSPTPASGGRIQLVAPYDPAPIQAALTGLRAEAQTNNFAPLLHHWTELVVGYVRLFCQPAEADPRIARLCAAVEADLARSWSMREMARLACMSEEHLRRLFHKATGRSPHQELMHLRMRRAAELLHHTGSTVEQVAHAVGYESPYMFSTAFKRLMGLSPSQYVRH